MSWIDAVTTASRPDWISSPWRAAGVAVTPLETLAEGRVRA